MIPRYWHNWIGNQEALAHRVAPRSLAELQEVVGRAATQGRVRPAGGSYAWSPLVPTRDTIVEMRQLRRGLAVELDAHGGTVTVEAGMSIAELTLFAAQHGLTLKSPTIFPRVTVGGVLSTGSHGTGLDRGGFADGALELTVVDASGRAVTIAEGDPRMAAARTALGSFGPIYSVKLRADRAFDVRVEERRVPIDRMLAGMVDAAISHDFVEVYWFPFTDHMWLMTVDRTHDRRDRPGLRWYLERGVNWALAKGAGNSLIPAIARYTPQLTPTVSGVAQHFGFREGVTVEPTACQFHYAIAYPKVWDVSYSVPLEQSAGAWDDALRLVRAYAAEGRYPINFVVHARYIGAGAALLGLSAGRPSCMIEVVTGLGTPGREEFFEEVERAWLERQGRPHWGKHFHFPEEILARRMYPGMEEFLALREAHDPRRVFLNPFLEHEVFQLPPLPG